MIKTIDNESSITAAQNLQFTANCNDNLGTDPQVYFNMYVYFLKLHIGKLRTILQNSN